MCNHVRYRMKRKYTSWEEAMNLREVKVRAMLPIIADYYEFLQFYICPDGSGKVR